MKTTIELRGGELNLIDLRKDDLNNFSREQLEEIIIKNLRVIRSLTARNENIREKAEEYKRQLSLTMEKAERRKNNMEYKEKTLLLYKRILQKLVGCEGDF